MQVDSTMLSKIASVIEKTAEYIERREAQTVTEQQEKRAEEAKRIADKLSSLTGEDLDNSITEKLAEIDPRIVNVLDRITGDDVEIDSMGGPGTAREKVASSIRSANDEFVEWVTGP